MLKPLIMSFSGFFYPGQAHYSFYLSSYLDSISLQVLSPSWIFTHKLVNIPLLCYIFGNNIHLYLSDKAVNILYKLFWHAWVKSSYWDNMLQFRNCLRMVYQIRSEKKNCIWSASHANPSLENDSDHHVHYQNCINFDMIF